MQDYNWHDFLSRWQRERTALCSKFAAVTPETAEARVTLESDSLEQNRKTETVILQLESRIGQALPASYRQYLECSGRMQSGVLRVGRVNWWKDKEERWKPQLADLPSDSYSDEYGQTRKLNMQDVEHLQASLYILPDSAWDNLIYLLNPLVVTAEGDWEAWSLSHTDLYVTKYASFWNLMQAQYAEFSERIVGGKLEPHAPSPSATHSSALVYPWQELLTVWSSALLKPGVREEFQFTDENIEEDGEQAAMIAAQWIGYAPASEAEIHALEMHLKQELPPSYRQFLQVTNGLGFHIGDLYLLHPISEVQWFAVNGYDEEESEDDDDSDSEEENPSEGFDHPSYHYRQDHQQASLEIGGYDGNDFYLLNPLVVTPEGEWEAWVKTKESGVTRYPSFWDMMQDAYFLYFLRNFPFS